jgi:hypothetical protein
LILEENKDLFDIEKDNIEQFLYLVIVATYRKAEIIVAKTNDSSNISN